MPPIEEYPLYQELRALLDKKDYGPKDPLNVFLEITARYERSMRGLSNRQVQLHAASSQQIQELISQVSELAAAIDENTDKMEILQTGFTTQQQHGETMIRAMADTAPVMLKTHGEMERCVKLLETKNVRGISLLLGAGALIFAAGFFACLIFK